MAAGGGRNNNKANLRRHSPPPPPSPPQPSPTLQPPITTSPYLTTTAFLITFSVYALTASRSIPGGDATELATAACQLGVAHPPGYPLFTILTHIIIKLLRPFTAVAHAANLASCLYGAIASTSVYLATQAMSTSSSDSLSSAAASFAASAAFAFSPLTWQYSIQSEVFALNNALCALLFYLVAKHDGTFLHTLLGATVCGLAACNQHTSVFYLAPCILFVATFRNGHSPQFTTFFRTYHLPAAAVGFALGLLPYAYLPLASPKGLPGSWGDTASMHGFLTHVLRREYGTFRLFSGLEATEGRFLRGIRLYAEHTVAETFGVGIVLAVGAVIDAAIQVLRSYITDEARTNTATKTTTKTTNSAPTLLAFASLVLYIVVFHYLANLPIENPLHLGVQMRFWMQADVTVYVLAGVGLARLVSSIPARKRGAFASFVVFATLLLPAMRYQPNDESSNTAFHTYARTILDPLPHKAKLIVKGDVITNSIRFLQRCENYRADVQVVDMAMLTYRWFVDVQSPNFPDFVFPGTNYHPYEPGAFSMRQLLVANVGRNVLDAARRGGDVFLGATPGKPAEWPRKITKQLVFMAGGWHEEDRSHEGMFEHLPYGMLDLVVPHGYMATQMRRAAFDDWRAHSLHAMELYRDIPTMAKSLFPHELARGILVDETRWERVCMSDLFYTHHKFAHALLQISGSRADDRSDAERHAVATDAATQCAITLRHVAEHHPFLSPYVLRNRGICLQTLLRCASGEDVTSDRAVELGRIEDDLAATFRSYLQREDPSTLDAGTRAAIEQIIARRSFKP